MQLHSCCALLGATILLTGGWPLKLFCPITIVDCLACRASREFGIENALDKMMADWEVMTFELGTWKATGTFILKGKSLLNTCVQSYQS